MGACTSKSEGLVVQSTEPGLAPVSRKNDDLDRSISGRVSHATANDSRTNLSASVAGPVDDSTPATVVPEADDHLLKDPKPAPSGDRRRNVSASRSEAAHVSRPPTAQQIQDDEEYWVDDGASEERSQPRNVGSSSRPPSEQKTTAELNAAKAAQRRRRLSVSTVDTSGVDPSLRGGKGKRGAIVKFDDPALQLVDKSRGQVKEVTLKMLNNLFPNSEHYAVFGSPCYHSQRTYDNKVQEIGGFMSPNTSLADHGVAISCKKGLKPESPNQDDFFALKVDDWWIYGVFDGHGPCGHDVSAFVHKTLPFLIISDPQFETDTPSALKRAFWRVHHLVEAAAEQPVSSLDCSLSGTTGTVIVQRDNTLYVAHVGDSRAVMAQKKDGKLCAMNLTNDHKPTNPEEQARIEASGGEVRRLEGDIPYRVFAVGRMYPGLAMSRALGDSVGAAVGVTPDPDIRVVDLSSHDKFFMICTDGVWEFISSQEAVDIVGRKKRSQVKEAAELLAHEAWFRWVEEEENMVDDITCIIVWGRESSAGKGGHKK